MRPMVIASQETMEETVDDETRTPAPQIATPVRSSYDDPTRCSSNGAFATDINSLRSDLTYLSHQVYRILLALHVPPCLCETCGIRHQEQNNIILTTSAAQSNNTSHRKPELNGHSDSNEDSELSETAQNGEVRLNTGATLSGSPLVMPHGDSAAFADPWSALMSQNGTSLHQNKNQHGFFSRSLACRPMAAYKPHRVRQSGSGRKSKYCTAAEKAAVAEHAAIHGASAAARKFNIPPAVAAYYHRKILNRSLPKGRRPRIDSDLYGGVPQEASTVSFMDAENTEDKPEDLSMCNRTENGNSSISDSGNSPDMPDLSAEGPSEETSEPLMPSSSLFPTQAQIQTVVNAWLQKPASPGFALRPYRPQQLSCGGRGRGRPKLIGDELDAKLLVHLSELRKGLTEKLTPDMVLRFASDFIRKESPGMLVEDGGTILLKPTWAMKVLTRLNDAERMHMCP